MAISAEIPACPFSTSDNCFRLTPSPLAAAVTLSPSGARQSWRIDKPGCGGRFIAMVSLLMLVNQINITEVGP